MDRRNSSGNEAGAAQRIYGTFTTPSSLLGSLATEDKVAPPGNISSAIRAVITPHIVSFREEIAAKTREELNQIEVQTLCKMNWMNTWIESSNLLIGVFI